MGQTVFGNKLQKHTTLGKGSWMIRSQMNFVNKKNEILFSNS